MTVKQLTARNRTGPPPMRSAVVLTVATLVGIAAFLGPFALSVPRVVGADRGAAHAGDAPLVFAALGVLCLFVLLAETGGRDPDAKRVALLGVLVATNAALRLVPDVFGASPIYFLPIMVGYVWGPSSGFLLGAASLALSALITGGVGPWMPFQMLTLGWVGMTAGLLPKRLGNPTPTPPPPPPGLRRERGSERFEDRDVLPMPRSSESTLPSPLPSAAREGPGVEYPALSRTALLTLAAFAGVWGFLFGAIMNLWFWPFAAPAVPADVGLYWAPGLGLAETARRYVVFYLTTSAAYDATRAVGNVAMMLLFGRPVLLLLARFRRRFTWEPLVSDETDSEPLVSR